MEPLLERLLRLGGFVSPAARPGEPLASALIEAAFLVAAADDVLSAPEIELIGEAMAFVWGTTVEGGEFEQHLERLNEARSRDRVDGRLRSIGASLSDCSERERVLRFAATVAICDRRVVPREHGTLLKLGKALGLFPEDVLRVMDEVRKVAEES